MLEITDFQYDIFKALKKKEIILSIAQFVKKQYSSKLENTNSDKIIGSVTNYVDWALQAGITKISNLEYFVSLCFNYNIKYEDLLYNKMIDSIVRYPSRIEDDKLFNIHYYLKYERT